MKGAGDDRRLGRHVTWVRKVRGRNGGFGFFCGKSVVKERLKGRLRRRDRSGPPSVVSNQRWQLQGLVGRLHLPVEDRAVRDREDMPQVDDLPALRCIIINKIKATNGVCATSGRQYIFERGSPWTMSVDRIDNHGSDAGYTDSNIQLVCHVYNCTVADSHSRTDGLIYLKWSKGLFDKLAPYIFECGPDFASRPTPDEPVPAS